MEHDPRPAGLREPGRGAGDHRRADIDTVDRRVRYTLDEPGQRAAVPLAQDENAPARSQPIEKAEPRPLEIASESGELQHAVDRDETVEARSSHCSTRAAIATNGVSSATSASTRARRVPRRGCSRSTVARSSALPAAQAAAVRALPASTLPKISASPVTIQGTT